MQALRDEMCCSCSIQENAGAAANAPPASSTKRPAPAAEPAASASAMNPKVPEAAASAQSSKEPAASPETTQEAEEIPDASEGEGLSECTTTLLQAHCKLDMDRGFLQIYFEAMMHVQSQTEAMAQT